MPPTHVVESGDCITSIAEATGHFWERIWYAAENGALRKTRKDPNCLVPGDRIHIPDLSRKEMAKSTGQRHRFERKGVPAKLRVRILSATGTPRANRRYRLDIDGKLAQGSTDADGFVSVEIPCGARAGTLTLQANEHFEEETYELALGELEPHTELKGAQARLRNLGANHLEIDGELGPETRTAIGDFQHAHDIPVTGKLDDRTAEKLREVHGS